MEREHLVKELDTLKFISSFAFLSVYKIRSFFRILNQRLLDEHDLHQTAAVSE